MCVPAQMYNLMKEKQINCMYRDCLKNHLNTGVSTVACDVALAEDPSTTNTPLSPAAQKSRCAA